MPKHVKSPPGEPCTTRGCLRCEYLWIKRGLANVDRVTSAFGYTEINLFGVELLRLPPGHPRGGTCKWCSQEAPVELLGKVKHDVSGCDLTRSVRTCAGHFNRAIDFVHWFFYPEYQKDMSAFYSRHARLARAA